MKLQNNKISRYCLEVEERNSNYILDYRDKRIIEAREDACDKVVESLQKLNRELEVL